MLRTADASGSEHAGSAKAALTEHSAGQTNRVCDEGLVRDVVIVSTADIDRVDQVKIRLRVWLLRWFFCRSILIFGWNYFGVQKSLCDEVCRDSTSEYYIQHLCYFFPVNSMTITYDKFKLSIF